MQALMALLRSGLDRGKNAGEVCACVRACVCVCVCVCARARANVGVGRAERLSSKQFERTGDSAKVKVEVIQH